MSNEAAEQLIAKWEHSARQHFYCAERTDEAIGKRMTEYGAMVYFNCAQALKELISTGDHE